MKKTIPILPWTKLAVLALLLVPSAVKAQREVHWQISPKGFPSDVGVFVDVEEVGVFKRDLTAAAFQVSIDEFAGQQGGWVLNQQQVVAGQAGADVLIVVDKSSSYTGEFKKAKNIIKFLIGAMDPRRDRIAVATAPATGGFQEAMLDVPFSSDPGTLVQAVNNLKTLPSDDKTGARLCNALSEGLRFFTDTPTNKYRAVVLITGGADKGEGKGDCVKDSFAAGLVPFFSIVFKLDKKYDDPRNAHKIENSTHDLAQSTGGQSIFRQSENSYKSFTGLFWNRVRSQYYLQIMFPCYRPMPTTTHASVLKVEGRDADPIQFEATSAPAPVPKITAIYPQQADSKAVDDGKVDLTIDGTGFCGEPGMVKVLLKNIQAATKSESPFRVVATLNQAHETGKVKIINRFGQSGESAMQFQITKPPKGAQTQQTLTYLVIGLVALALIAIVAVGLRSRKAKPPKGGKPIPKPRKSDVPSQQSAAAKTMAISAIESAWAVLANGTKVNLQPGNNIIGREETCQIKIATPSASREHARIEFDDTHGLIWVEDMGSSNGTFFGKGDVKMEQASKLDKRQLVSSGDVIWIGGEKITVHFKGGVQGEG
jgi:hypothetical protein